MTPIDATEKQLEIYRRMTGEERLSIGLRLHELSCNVVREGIRATHPNATHATVEKLLRERIESGYKLRQAGSDSD